MLARVGLMESNAGVFLWNMRNFYERLFFTEHLRWLLLIMVVSTKAGFLQNASERKTALEYYLKKLFRSWELFVDVKLSVWQVSATD